MHNKEILAETTDEQRTDAESSTSASVAANPVLSAALSVEEGNRLIAEFMGGKFLEMEEWEHPHNGKICYSEKWMEPKDIPYCTSASIGIFNYHSSWDWLMPVVEKIESLDCTFEVQIFRNCAKIIPDQFHDFLIPKIETTKIEATWLAVGEFIKWYNDNAAAVGSR